MDLSPLEVLGPSTFKELQKKRFPEFDSDVLLWVPGISILESSMEERLKKPLFQHITVNLRTPHFPTSILHMELQRTVKFSKLDLET